MEPHTLGDGLLSSGYVCSSSHTGPHSMGSHSVEAGLLPSASYTGIRTEAGSGGRENEASELEYLSIDSMLLKYVGEFGWGQILHFVLVCSAWIPTAMQKMAMIFSDRVPEWECAAQSNGKFNGTAISVVAEQCTSSSSICVMDRGSWEWVGGKGASTVSEWDLICGEEYKTGLVGSMFFVGILIGAGLWGHVSDSVLGRKGTVTLALVATATLGLLTSFAPSFWVYTLLRFLTGVSCSGISQCTFVLATEVIGPSKRGSVGMSVFYFFSLGVMMLPVFGYFTHSWRSFYLAIALFNVAYCLLAIPLVHESPRWYLVKGRVEDAMRVLRFFARWNGNVVPECTSLTLDEGSDPSVAGSPKEGNAEEDLTAIALPIRVDSKPSVLLRQGTKSAGTLVDVFRCKETRRRLMIMISVWFSTGLVYYGINLNVANVGFNLYVSVFLNGLIEMPALAITAALSGKLGRRAVQVGSMGLSSFCCLLGSMLFTDMADGALPVGLRILNPKSQSYHGEFAHLLGVPDSNITSIDSTIGISPGRFFYSVQSLLGTDSGTGNLISVLRLLCGVMGLFGIAGGYSVVYSYTTELFPTVVRNTVLGLCAQAAGIGSVGGPIIAVLGRVSPALPFLIFGVLGMTGAALGSRLPETLDQPLWETMEGMERAYSIKKEIRGEEHKPLEKPVDHLADDRGGYRRLGDKV